MHILQILQMTFLTPLVISSTVLKDHGEIRRKNIVKKEDRGWGHLGEAYLLSCLNQSTTRPLIIGGSLRIFEGI